jgi:threonine synthase
VVLLGELGIPVTAQQRAVSEQAPAQIHRIQPDDLAALHHLLGTL